MRWVVGALVFVAVLAVAGIAVGIVGGLMADLGAHSQDRPWFTWVIALCYLGVEMIFWPALVSWYLRIELPSWHRKWLVTRRDEGREEFEQERHGRRVIDVARILEPEKRSRLARQVIGYGLFYVALTVPAPILLGVGALRVGSFQPLEAIPIILAVWIPAVWIGSLVVRSLVQARAGNTHIES